MWPAFVARAEVDPAQQGDHHLKHTTSTCPGCLALLPADVVIRDNKVYFVKDCAKCGPSEALVSEDAKYYVDAYSFARAGTEPLVFATEVAQGCPTDCGTCGDHEQHTCLPIIEITDYCNLECPVCIVNNTNANHLSNEAFARMIDTLVRNEGQVESIALSGGEPTSHPRLMELIEIATREEIGRIVIITNGLRLGRDRAFAEKIKASGADVALQFDGFTADTHEKIRGRDLCDEKSAALKMLKDLEADYNRRHFDRKAPLDRLRDLGPEEKQAYESYLVRSCVSGVLRLPAVQGAVQEADAVRAA